MLVLSRKRNEEIHFDGPGRLVVVEIRGDRVRLGFEAPATTTILRPDAKVQTPPEARIEQPMAPCSQIDVQG